MRYRGKICLSCSQWQIPVTNCRLEILIWGASRTLNSPCKHSNNTVPKTNIAKWHFACGILALRMLQLCFAGAFGCCIENLDFANGTPLSWLFLEQSVTAGWRSLCKMERSRNEKKIKVLWLSYWLMKKHNTKTFWRETVRAKEEKI